MTKSGLRRLVPWSSCALGMGVLGLVSWTLVLEDRWTDERDAVELHRAYSTGAKSAASDGGTVGLEPLGLERRESWYVSDPPQVLAEPPVTREVVPTSTRTRLAAHVAARLRRHGETIEDYHQYSIQTAETERVVVSLLSRRLFEELRRVRFDSTRYASELAGSREMTARLEELLRTLCDSIVERKRSLWDVRKLRDLGDQGYVRKAERDLVERESWLELEGEYADAIREADRRLRRHFGVNRAVIAR